MFIFIQVYFPILIFYFCSVLGPGPGRYGLPSTCGYISHDFTKWKSPAYSFGSRLENSSKYYFLHMKFLQIHPKYSSIV